MVKIRCQDCGRIVATDKIWDENTECSECDGSFAELNSDDDCYEEETPEEETYTCEECGEDFSDEETIQFKNSELIFCKKCMQKAMPSSIQTKIEYKDRIIEKPIEKIVYLTQDGTPIDNTFNPNNKTRFD